MKNKNNKFVQIFDILFIMVLCFVTLLATMLSRGAVIVGSGAAGGIKYVFVIWSFAITFIGLIIYLIFVLTHSNRELGSMVKEFYGDKEDDSKEEIL